MNIQNHKTAFKELGNFFWEICAKDSSKKPAFSPLLREKMESAIDMAPKINSWFTRENILFSLDAWSRALAGNKIDRWLEGYKVQIDKMDPPARVAVIMAGNIPLVGLHDALCVLASNNILLAKVSSDDAGLTQAVLSVLTDIEPEYRSRVVMVEGKLENFDKVIATGSNNTARYFQYYFGSYPHIIRKNRNGAGIIRGVEGNFPKLGEDIFRYFGLGCRNVSLLFMPKGLDIGLFMANFADRENLKHHNKYMNNYQYHKALYMLNGERFYDNGFFMMKESDELHSPVGTVHYIYYQDVAEISSFLERNEGLLQCVVEEGNVWDKSIPYGKSQFPELWDYADNINTMNFLLTPNSQPPTPNP